MRTSEERIAKLPKWAQQLIKSQDRIIEMQAKKLKEMRANLPTEWGISYPVFDPAGNRFVDVNVPSERVQIRCEKRPSGYEDSIQIHSTFDRKARRIVRISSSSGFLTVLPHSGNVIEIHDRRPE